MSVLFGLDPTALVERFGSPLYIYDLDIVARRTAALRDVLPAPFELAYAVKANPSLAVVAHLASLGLGADVASGGELALVARAGFAADRIVFTGPGKRDDELAAAVETGIRAITVESAGELERLEAIARARGVRPPILLRATVAPTGAERTRIVGDEGLGKFGIAAADLPAVAERAARSAHVRLLGLHAFGASNVVDVDEIADHVAATVASAAALARATGAPLRLVDAGGGLGIPYADDDPSLDLAALGARLTALAAGWATDPVTRAVRVLFEPGRHLVGPAGAYVARVVDRKPVAGGSVVVLDGGINHFVRPALTGQAHRIVALGSGRADGPAPDPGGRTAVVGPLCSGLDVLARETALPAVVGDLVAIIDAGAYGYTESMPFFLSHPIPAEVVVRDGVAALARPRIEPSDWLDRQLLPSFDERADVSDGGALAGRR
ncbi:MAG TPA: alanine racemase [Candidatus Limnocylindrales bacterium]|nr:alanine racemase [Candidatus Limnocylindrales bacterium]